MRDIEFQQQLPGIRAPWRVHSVDVDRAAKTVETTVVHTGDALRPTRSKPCAIYDHRERRWRHLDLYELRAYVNAREPRVSCDEHGVHQLAVPWAGGKTSFTALFERLAISLLAEMTIMAVAKTLGLS